MKRVLSDEKNLIMLFFVAFGLAVIGYSSVKYGAIRSELIETRILAVIFYAPLVCYALLYLAERKLPRLNYLLSSLYIMSFFAMALTGDITLMRQSLILFVIPVILLIYVSTEGLFELRQFLRMFVSVLIFFVISAFLLHRGHSAYIVLILVINAFILTYFLSDILVHSLFNKSERTDEQ